MTPNTTKNGPRFTKGQRVNTPDGPATVAAILPHSGDLITDADGTLTHRKAATVAPAAPEPLPDRRPARPAPDLDHARTTRPLWQALDEPPRRRYRGGRSPTGFTPLGVLLIALVSAFAFAIFRRL